MRFSATLFFFLLFIGVFYAYIKLVPEEPSVQVPLSSLDIPSEDVLPDDLPLIRLQENEEIEAISIVSDASNESIVITRSKDGIWELEEPYRDAADPLMVDGLVSALKLSKATKSMQVDEGFSEYGLEPAVLTIGVKTSDRAVMRFLDIGEVSPVSDNRYAKWQDQSRVFLVDRRLKSAFAKDAFSFRHKGVIRHSLQGIKKVKLQTFFHTFEMKYDAGQWVWSEPIGLMGENISAQKMGVFLSFLKGLYVKEFLPEKRPLLSDYGLDPEKASIQIWTSDDKKVEHIKIGQDVSTRDAFYAKREDRSFVFLLSREKVSEIFGLLDQILQENQETVSAY